MRVDRAGRPRRPTALSPQRRPGRRTGDDLDAAVARGVRERTLRAVQDAADAAGIGNARYNVASEVVAHPHLAARSRWREIGSPGGPVTAALPPPVFGDRLPAMGGCPDSANTPTRVLGWLGYRPTRSTNCAARPRIGPELYHPKAAKGRTVAPEVDLDSLRPRGARIPRRARGTARRRGRVRWGARQRLRRLLRRPARRRARPTSPPPGPGRRSVTRTDSAGSPGRRSTAVASSARCTT